LFREAAKRIHPDQCKDSADLKRRTRLMAEANRCYQAGDMEGLQRILEQYDDESDTVEQEGIGAELIRIIRQISLAKNRLSAIQRELASLCQGEIALLRNDAEKRELEGRDPLADLAASVREQIERAKKEHEALVNAND